MKKTVRIFVSYSHKDSFWQQLLMPMLKFKDVDVKAWTDKDIEPGTVSHDEIQRALAEMDIFLPLVSQNFANPGYITEHECPIAKQRYAKKEIEVLPVLIHRPDPDDCDWILKLQYLPESGRSWALIRKEYAEHDLAMKPIREGVRKVVARVLAKKP